MMFTTKHVMYQVKESVFVTYLYAGISAPSVHLDVNSQYTSRARSRDTCHVIQPATLATFQSSVHIYHVNRYSSRYQFKDHITF